MKNYISRVSVVAALLAAAVAWAEEEPVSRLSTTVGTTVTNAYIWRGAVLENQGGVLQPYGQVDVDLFHGDGVVNQVTPFVGIWSSIHGDTTFAQPTSQAKSWYEFDLYSGVAATFQDRWTASVAWYLGTSPSDAFSRFQYVDLKLEYDDSGLWKGLPDDFGINPYVLLELPTQGLVSTGTRKGQYLEAGIAPGVTINSSGDYPLNVSVPISVGLGFNHYYGSGSTMVGGNEVFTGSDNETFGFAAVGVEASVPLKFMQTSGYGDWTLKASVTYYSMGDGVRDFNQLSVSTTDQSYQVVGALNVEVSF